MRSQLFTIILCLSVYLSVCFFICLSLPLSPYLFASLSISFSICVNFYPSLSLFTCPSLSLSVSLYVDPSVLLFIYLLFCPSVLHYFPFSRQCMSLVRPLPPPTYVRTLGRILTGKERRLKIGTGRVAGTGTGK